MLIDPEGVEPLIDPEGVEPLIDPEGVEPLSTNNPIQPFQGWQIIGPDLVHGFHPWLMTLDLFEVHIPDSPGWGNQRDAPFPWVSPTANDIRPLRGHDILSLRGCKRRRRRQIAQQPSFATGCD